ncbi:hypothetical protein K523DRAFT_323316 [Schizophyllum commune Tattone D]|nr:hypothetical protein K523DRAFT_323316 [Schizophyllum commune Tattone D]
MKINRVKMIGGTAKMMEQRETQSRSKRPSKKTEHKHEYQKIKYKQVVSISRARGMRKQIDSGVSAG